MSKLKLSALLVSALCAAPAAAQTAPAAAQTQEPAGRILWSVGQVERVGADGTAKPLAKGDAVFQGDLIRSAADSHAQLVMSDEALLAVRAGSSVKLTEYRYAGREDGSERALIELLTGGLRSITGAIGRSNKDNYQLKNDTHVIGIRGTDHETFATKEGTFNRVTLGGTYLRSDGGQVELAPGETGFVPMRLGAAPSRLDRAPDFMHLAVLSPGNTGPGLRGFGADDERRLQKSLKPPVFAPSTAAPALPAQALGAGHGWGQGGRCDGPCADVFKNRNKSK
jgi:hypothetical protein